MTGIEMIAAERERQQSIEGWTPEHDEQHRDEALAWAAACYAARGRIFREGTDHRGYPIVYDAWPDSWSLVWDKRKKHTRLKQLAIAGALIAAEIDRLQRVGEKP